MRCKDLYISVANLIQGFTGADLNALAKEAAMCSMKRGKTTFG